MNSADLCRKNGWKIGTKLAGEGMNGTAIIVITAIGEKCVLAKMVAENGTACVCCECEWGLTYCEWQEVE